MGGWGAGEGTEGGGRKREWGGAVPGPWGSRLPRAHTAPACSSRLSPLPQYPEGYLEALAKKEKEKENRKRAAEEEEEEEDEDFSSPRKGKRKSKPAGGCLGAARASSALPALTARSVPGGRTGAGSPGRTPKKSKVEPYSLTAQQRGLVREDQSNAKLWAELLKALTDGPVSVPRAPPPRPPAPKQRGRDAGHRHRRDVSAQWH